ncbi:olfactory receptor 11H6-like [Equus przewalskii]|uniref:Olfactory receptor 11H6-like n=1 Tax=Equus przewalskii TaxID=9798 RepID=A0ABM4P397_EQUPR|nr:olfactory receptor family 11 subfamily H member 31 [Equus caballus]
MHFMIEFVLLSLVREMQNFFSIILVVYFLILLGNGAIVCAVKWDRRLQMPMYILGNSAFLEIWYISSTVTNTLVNILSKTKTFSFTKCFLQFYFFFPLGTTESFFLPVMAYDQYLAICRPLHYPSIMTGKFCVILVCVFWVNGFLCYPVPIVLISQLPFCRPNIIDHFMCDPGPLFALTCIFGPSTELICYTFNSVIIFGPFLSILGSYILVLRAVLHVPSGAGLQVGPTSSNSSFLHMWVPPHGGVFTLWIPYVDVGEPNIREPSRNAEGCHFGIFDSDSAFKSPCL